MGKKETMNIISIPEDAVTEVKIGGTFYQRLNKLLIDFGDSVDKKTLITAMAKIQRDRIMKDDYAFNLETLIILLRDIEQAFKTAGFSEDNKIEVELPDDHKEVKLSIENELNSLDQDQEEESEKPNQ